MRRARTLWQALKARAARLGAGAVEGSRFSSMGAAELRREVDDALAGALEPDERIELDTWWQMSGPRARAGDPADLDVSTPLAAVRSVGSAAGMLRAAIGAVDSALPVRVVLTDRRLLVSHRTVTSRASVRAAPRSGATAVRRRFGTMTLDPGDGGPPLRLSTLIGDPRDELVSALGRRRPSPGAAR